MRIASMTGPKRQMGVVKSKKLLVPKVYEVEVLLPEIMIFRSGHYVSIKVNDSGIRRSYSVVSYKDKVLKLLVDTGPGGLGSVFFEGIEVGSSIEVMGFFGNFYIDSSDLGPNKTLYFVATGTGVAPFLPMLIDLKKRFIGKVTLWWGVRFVNRVYWQEELAKLKEDWSNFEYEMYVSRPEVEWTGKVGRVGDDLDGVKTENTSWYLCGATEMIEQMKERLIDKGVTEDNINYEKFF